MPDRSRIPVSPRHFNSYITASDYFLQATDPNPPHLPNWQRLGLTQQDAGYWHEQRDYWEHVLYKKYISAVLHTKVVTAEVNLFIASFRAFGMPLLHIMAASPNATLRDALALNFKLHHQKRTQVFVPISELCVPKLKPIGGGRMKIACNSSTLVGRPALIPYSDSVMVAYKIGNPAPLHINDGTTIITRGRAKFIHDFGAENAGSLIHIFCCFNDMKRPERKGPWSDLRSIHLF